MPLKNAILSMDIEDWYHLYYFMGKADTSFSMLDGFTNYVDLMNKHNAKTTFFVLGELARGIKDELNYAISCGHEIACHGYTHLRPLDMDVKEFKSQLIKAKETIEDVIGKEVTGYRAPCYGIDDERYQIVKEVGFKYSSSKMNVKGHPLYGDIDLATFEEPIKGVFVKDGITEFALSTEKCLGKDIAVSGGGWIRLLPWGMLMKPLIKKNVKKADCYTLYIHPFELSKKDMPKVDGTGFLTNVRARTGLKKVDKKIEKLIEILKKENYALKTFETVRQEIEKNK